MEYLKANIKQADEIYYVVQETIKEIYPNYYPKEVVDFFCQLHSKESIIADINNELLGVLIYNGNIIATGCYKNNHITRIYVLPNYQKRGYGSYIIECLEKEIIKDYNKVFLDASLPAAKLYEKLGYKTIKHEKCKLENGIILAYEIMEKPLMKSTTIINYNNKVFKVKDNTLNGEVSNDTTFYYHQDKNVVWAEYAGGKVKRGQIIGIVDKNGELDFYYQHINGNNELKIGKCHSQPTITNNKIELLEKWQWLNDDESEGTSIIVEI